MVYPEAGPPGSSSIEDGGATAGSLTKVETARQRATNTSNIILPRAITPGAQRCIAALNLPAIDPILTNLPFPSRGRIRGIRITRVDLQVAGTLRNLNRRISALGRDRAGGKPSSAILGLRSVRAGKCDQRCVRRRLQQPGLCV